MNDIVLRVFTDYVLPLVGSGIMLYGGHLLFMLKAKIDNDSVKMAMDQLSKVTKIVVQNLNQTTIADIKRVRALTDEDKRDIKKQACLMIKARMQDNFIELLSKKNVDVDGLISSEIESYVYELKCKE